MTSEPRSRRLLFGAHLFFLIPLFSLAFTVLVSLTLTVLLIAVLSAALALTPARVVILLLLIFLILQQRLRLLDLAPLIHLPVSIDRLFARGRLVDIVDLGPALGGHARVVETMRADVGVDGLEIGLVDHAELVLGLFRGVGRVGRGDDDVESALEDGSEGDAFDAGKGEEGDGFLEAEDDAGGEEEEVA